MRFKDTAKIESGPRTKQVPQIWNNKFPGRHKATDVAPVLTTLGRRRNG